MEDGAVLMGLFGPRSPVPANVGRWIAESMDWFLGQFGQAVLAGPVLVPDGSFFPGAYGGSEADVKIILRALCDRMDVPVESIHLEMTLPDPTPQVIAGQPIFYRSSGEAGHYEKRGDSFVIALSEAQLPDPQAVTAVIAHEIGHVRLLGEGRIDPGRKDGEQLTDLLTVFLGAGVFNANASLSFRKSTFGWGASQVGYLDERMYGFAFAYYARMRTDHLPDWSRYLDLNPRTYMKQATKYLQATTPVAS
jgi:hypothetical protein